MSLLLAALVSTLQPDELTGCTMLRLSRAPSRSRRLLREQIDVCAQRGQPGDERHFTFTLRRSPRGAPDVTRQTSSQACPAARQRLIAAESLPMPTIEILPRARPVIVIADGVGYQLQVRWAPYRDEGQQGSLTIGSNANTPLAQWADSLFEALEPCWRAPEPNPLAPPPEAR